MNSTAKTPSSKVPRHPKGYKFAAGADGFYAWHVSAMRYEITSKNSFEVLDTVSSIGHFMRVAVSLKALASLY